MESTKRRKIAPSTTSNGNVDISDLPNETLVKIFLGVSPQDFSWFIRSGISTAPSSSWRRCKWKIQPNVNSRLVLSSFASAHNDDDDDAWSILDFADIDGNRLTDDDVGALLSCIDAVHKVKRLKLAGCTSISGVGLEPIRGSLVLEQIDLSLVKEHRMPEIDHPVPLLSQSKVLPILSSIISMDGNRLKQFQFPQKWCAWVGSDGRRNPAFGRFLSDYSLLLDSRPFNCCMCSENVDCIGRYNDEDWVCRDSCFYKFLLVIHVSRTVAPRGEMLMDMDRQLVGCVLKPIATIVILLNNATAVVIVFPMAVCIW